MKKPGKAINRQLPTDFGVVGKLLDDASSDLPNQYKGFLDSIKGGFKKFFSPPNINTD